MLLVFDVTPQVRETQNDRWQDVREGGKAGEVFDGGSLVEGSGQVVVANHCCCLMRPQAWEDLSLSLSHFIYGLFNDVNISDEIEFLIRYTCTSIGNYDVKETFN